MSQLNVGKVNVTGDGVQYPQYTNSNRPTGSTGLVIYNTDEAKLQVYTGSAWENIGAADDGGEIVLSAGNRSQRPNAGPGGEDRERIFRWNTETRTHETYYDFSNSGSGARDGWYAIGGY